MWERLKNLGLRPKMAASILFFAAVALFGAVLWVGLNARDEALKEGKEKTISIAGRYAAEVQSRMQVAMDAARTLAQSLEGMKIRGVPPRDMMDGVLKNLLEKYPNFLAVWTCWEPNALDGKDFQFINAVGHDGTGRFIPYWNRLSGQVDVRPLKDYTVPGKGDYYLVPLHSGKETVFDPIAFKMGEDTLHKTILTVPVNYEGKTVGVVGVEIMLESFQPLIKTVKIYDIGYGVVVSNSAITAVHARSDIIGKSMKGLGFAPEVLKFIGEGREFQVEIVSPITNRLTFYTFTPISLGTSAKKWCFVGNVPLASVTHNATVLFWQSIVVGVIGIAVLGIIVWFLAGGISKPILNMANTVRRVANERDLTLDIPVSSHDEIGVMAREFNNMMKALRQSFLLFDDAAEHVNAQAGEVARRATANRDRAENEEKQMSTIQDTVLEMGETAGEVQGSSARQAEAASTSFTSVEQLIENMQDVNASTSEQIQDASVATERVAAMGETAAKVTSTARRQSEQVSQVTAAMQQIAKSVGEMTRAAERATEQGRTVLGAAEEGRLTVDATVAGMHAIKDSSDQISDIIGVITDISEQTNLLALNAAIEAARAGVHGKGFAVVADEVGKLAQRSAEAAKEVTQLIKDSTSKVDEGARLTDRSQEALRKIAEGGEINMRAIEEIARATELLSDNTSEVNQLVEDLNKLAQDIVNMAGQQGQRREAAQKALAALVEKANAISTQVGQATERAQSVGQEMRGVLDRSGDMKKMTDVQAGRSQTLKDITSESAQRAKQTVSGAGEVVGITLEMQRLAANLTRQVAQFRIRKGKTQANTEVEIESEDELTPVEVVPTPVD